MFLLSLSSIADIFLVTISLPCMSLGVIAWLSFPVPSEPSMLFVFAWKLIMYYFCFLNVKAFSVSLCGAYS